MTVSSPVFSKNALLRKCGDVPELRHIRPSAAPGWNMGSPPIHTGRRSRTPAASAARSRPPMPEKRLTWVRRVRHGTDPRHPRSPHRSRSSSHSSRAFSRQGRPCRRIPDSGRGYSSGPNIWSAISPYRRAVSIRFSMSRRSLDFSCKEGQLVQKPVEMHFLIDMGLVGLFFDDIQLFLFHSYSLSEFWA